MHFQQMYICYGWMEQGSPHGRPHLRKSSGLEKHKDSQGVGLAAEWRWAVLENMAWLENGDGQRRTSEEPRARDCLKLWGAGLGRK